MKLRTEKIKYSLALAFFLSVAENSIPHPIPFLRLGLANTALLLSVRFFSFAEMVVLVFFKTLLQLFLSGLILTPLALVSIAANLVALIALLFLRKTKFFSFVGISCLSAFFSNIAQCAVLYFFLLGSGAKNIYAMILFFGVAASAVTGLLANYLYETFLENYSKPIVYDLAQSQKINMDFKISAKAIINVLLMTLLIIVSACLVPNGEVILSINRFNLTDGALKTGLNRASVVLLCYAASFLFRSFCKPKGRFLSDVLYIYSGFLMKFTEGNKRRPLREKIKGVFEL